MIFVKTRATDGTNIVQFEILATYRLYEASYYHYTYDADDSIVKIDGKTISDAPLSYYWWRAFGSYGEKITIGTLHKIEIYYDFCNNYDSAAYHSEYGSAGVATVLIYKAD